MNHQSSLIRPRISRALSAASFANHIRLFFLGFSFTFFLLWLLCLFAKSEIKNWVIETSSTKHKRNTKYTSKLLSIFAREKHIFCDIVNFCEFRTFLYYYFLVFVVLAAFYWISAFMECHMLAINWSNQFFSSLEIAFRLIWVLDETREIQ